MTHKEAVALVCKDMKDTGYILVPQTHSAATGPDIEVWTGKRSYKVEVKVAKCMTNGGWQINPLEERHTDLVAIVLPTKRIIYSTLKDHKRLVGPKGYRGITDYLTFFNAKT